MARRARQGMTLGELLAASPRGHRRAVATALGAGDDRPEAIASVLLDEPRLAAIVAALDAPARAAATAVAVLPAVAVAPGRGSTSAEALVALERHGIAFAFGTSWWREYAVPADLRAPLRRVRAAAHARRLPERDARGAGSARWVGASQQIAHDAAALSAHLAGTPPRLKADGDVYVREWPKLTAALPAIDGLDADGFGSMRVGLALDLLRRHALLRVRVDDAPGKEPRRELVPAGDLPGHLGRDPSTLAAELRFHACRGYSQALAATLVEALPGRALPLPALGAALGDMLIEAGLDPYANHNDLTRALSVLGPLWLAGMIQLGVRAGTEPSLVRLAPAPIPDAAAPLGVCQASFEVVCLRAPTPAERARLALVAQPHPGQAHVLTLTRDSVRRAERALGEGGARATLEGLVGALPQNVSRSLDDWAGGVRAPLRLRSALFLDAGDAATAEALATGALAGVVVERLGERLLALDGTRAATIAAAVAAAGHDLEPGLDRVSGIWREDPERSREARALWGPDPPGDGAAEHAPEGALASTLTAAKRASPARRPAPVAPRLLDPLQMVTVALERDLDLDIVYAGRNGISQRRITPLEVEGGTLHAWCYLREDERSFQLAGIREAVLAG